MGSFNGFIASVDRGWALNQSDIRDASESIPQKLFRSALFAARVTGFSGGNTVTLNVIGAIGGTTFVIAGVGNVNAVGNYMLGATSSGTSLIPKPSHVITLATSGVTSGSVIVDYYMAGEY